MSEHWQLVAEEETVQCAPLHGEVVVAALAAGDVDGLVALGSPGTHAVQRRVTRFDVVLVAQALGS